MRIEIPTATHDTDADERICVVIDNACPRGFIGLSIGEVEVSLMLREALELAAAILMVASTRDKNA